MSLPATTAPRLGDLDWRWAAPRIALVFVATRLLVLVVAVAVEVTQPAPPEGVRSDDRPLLASLTSWDGVYYNDIAENGYQAGFERFPSYAFYPAFPVLVRAASVLTLGDISLAAILASNAAFLAALVLLFALSVRHLQPDRAIWSLWFLALAPGAIAFSMSYTEGLFLLFAAATFLAAESRHPWLAGIALALAALTRVPGILLLLPVVVLYIGRDGWRPTRDWIPLLLAPLALAGFFAYLWTITGDFLASFHAQEFWRPTGPNGAETVAAAAGPNDAASMAMGVAPSLVVALWVASLAFYAFLFVYFRHDRIKPAYWLVAILAIVGIFASGRLQSSPRYLAVAWPFDWVLANRDSRFGRSLVLTVFAGLHALLLWLAFTWSVPP